MKKTILWAALLGAVLFTSCGDDKKEFVEQFAQAAAAKDMQALEGMYPDSKDLGEIALQYTPEQITISEEQEGQPIEATIGNVKIVMIRDAEGALKVQSTKGLLSVDAQKLEFAKSTGWYNAERTDKENADALKDEGFIPFITQGIVSSLSNCLSVSTRNYETFEYCAEWGGDCPRNNTDFIVKNSSNVDIPGEAYTLIVKGVFSDGMPMGSNTQNYNGQNVPANGTITITGPKYFELAGGGTTYSASLSVNTDYLMQMDLTQLGFTPTGGEYADYLNSK